MSCSFTRIPYEGTVLPASGTQVLYNSASLSNSGLSMPLTASYVQWVTFHVLVDQNTDNAFLVEYSMDGGENWVTHSTTAVSNAGTGITEGEVYIGHFEHVRLSFTNGSTTQTTFSLNLNLHTGDRGPIGL